MSQRRFGFSLVELLVVITIVGIILAMLLPAINMVREVMRQGTCLNNQKSLGTAIMMYEGSKQYLPGWINRTPGNAASWPVILLPFLDRKDMWEQGGKTGNPPATRVSLFVCPDDRNAPLTPTTLSFVVNENYFLDRSINPPKDITGKNSDDIGLCNVKNPAQTVMLGERTNEGGGRPSAGPWNIIVASDRVKFTCPSPAAAGGTISPNVFTSDHGNVVILTYFDGRALKLKDTTPCNDPNQFSP